MGHNDIDHERNCKSELSFTPQNETQDKRMINGFLWRFRVKRNKLQRALLFDKMHVRQLFAAGYFYQINTVF
jgi:hypothetical protein